MCPLLDTATPQQLLGNPDAMKALSERLAAHINSSLVTVERLGLTVYSVYVLSVKMWNGRVWWGKFVCKLVPIHFVGQWNPTTVLVILVRSLHRLLNFFCGCRISQTNSCYVLLLARYSCSEDGLHCCWDTCTCHRLVLSHSTLTSTTKYNSYFVLFSASGY